MDRESITTALSPGADGMERDCSDATAQVKPVLALIDEHPLRKVSLATLLAARAQNFTIESFANDRELSKHSRINNRRIDIIVLSVGADAIFHESLQRGILRLQGELPAASFVIVCDRDDKAMSERAMQLGAKAYIPTTLAPPVAIAALMLVYAGGIFVPPVNAIEPRKANAVSRVTLAAEKSVSSDVPDCDVLTPRQQQVIGLLKRGKSNKVIAYELCVQESTVKVHVREIMKKLHASNRTHAAFLAS